MVIRTVVGHIPFQNSGLIWLNMEMFSCPRSSFLLSFPLFVPSNLFHLKTIIEEYFCYFSRG